jgi:hypothetical protein
MKVPIECPVFRAYLQNEIPDAFDVNGLMDTEHEGVLCREMIDIEGLDVRSLVGIEHFINLSALDIDNNPKIKHLPRLPNTLKAFFSNHKFDTSAQPVFYHEGRNYVMLENGYILWCVYRWYSLDEFKASWLTKRDDADDFAPFITECEQYLSKPKQAKSTPKTTKLTATMAALALYLTTDNGVSSAEINKLTKTTLGRDAWRNLRDVAKIAFTETEHKIKKNGATSTYKRRKISESTYPVAVEYFQKNMRSLVQAKVFRFEYSDPKEAAKAYIRKFKELNS